MVVKTVKESTTNLTTLLKALFIGHETLQKTLCSFSLNQMERNLQSHLVYANAIDKGELILQLGGNTCIIMKLHRVIIMKLHRVK